MDNRHIYYGGYLHILDGLMTSILGQLMIVPFMILMALAYLSEDGHKYLIPLMGYLYVLLFVAFIIQL